MPAEWLITIVSIDSTSWPWLLEFGDEVGDRLVLQIEIQEDPDIPELERAIDEDDLLAELGGRGDGHVDRQRRATDAALRAEHGDDLTGVASRRQLVPPAP